MTPDERQHIKDRVAAAVLAGTTLAELAGKFENRTLMRDLQEAGLHGLLVRIRLNDALDVVPPHVARCDDQEGRIGWSYPVTASIFDFSVEAPVQGLPALPNANIGIPWHCLVPVKRRKP